MVSHQRIRNHNFLQHQTLPKQCERFDNDAVFYVVVFSRPGIFRKNIFKHRKKASKLKYINVRDICHLCWQVAPINCNRSSIEIPIKIKKTPYN